MLATKLHSVIEQIAPIMGVSVADPDDRSTWSICFKDEATEEQKDAALALLESWAPPNLSSVTPIQARDELWDRSQLAAFDAWVKGVGGRTAYLWEYSLIYAREGSVLTAGLAALGLSRDQIDRFFQSAGSR